LGDGCAEGSLALALCYANAQRADKEAAILKQRKTEQFNSTKEER